MIAIAIGTTGNAKSIAAVNKKPSHF